MNTTEKFHLPVDGVLEMFNTFSRHHRSQSPTLTPVLQQQHPKVLSKTSMGLLETVKGRWRQQDKRAVASVSSDPLPHRCAAAPCSTGAIKSRNCHRIVVLGAPRVGKTNVVRRFLGEDFQEQYEPTAEDFHRKLFHIGGETYQVDLLDASMERNFPAKRRLSILTGDIFLLVFSLDDRESFSEVCELLGEIRAAKTKLLKFKRPARLPVVVCGNKADLAAQRAVSRSEVAEALTQDITFVETSAKRGTGLEAVFKELAIMGGLPDETSPSRHHLVSMVTYQSLCASQWGRRRSRTPCAVVDSLVRRPSFGSDLRLVLGSSTKANKPERCQIQ
uniref:GTP-binding protein Rhes n=1 Tax=Doryrhamphus excisus TaxID=161450 RepID=UPI0025AE2DB8|nr:GTP-binding protein Rhes [Doryrhamphus excisus]XP_057904281.1 GTP-binding protein Rhes [Doryrhamphus excisus]XP_057904282.1 GTP-binding protein Rhes [Doryrhamphus excisus]XP_057904283.1 GTP-binding protein Rhes [Doryrhamphus excisus]XP_057904284.1 GTP-binding protein Rhes [Doryrhamphus excisus]